MKNKSTLQGFLLLLLMFLVLTPDAAHAVREPRPQTIDGRMKTLSYHPSEVYKFTGYYYFQTIIELEEGEVIQTISVGAPTEWQIQPSGRRIFIKPISTKPEDALTNMTVITDKRMYFFELHAAEAEDVTDQKIPFIIRFVYPNQSAGKGIEQISTSGLDLSDKSKYNFNYTVSGSENISPIQVFDDHQFTYFKFPDNSPIPGFFEVDTEGFEALVNYRVEGEYIVVERVLSQYTLRYGPDIACIYNETNPLKLHKKRKKLFNF
ncbi:MAG: virB9 2 [Rickettsiales bacterium]|jgi:type IV secretion system protein VirB9|nr:virB9 2 [Rickettsiales bacterium]